jgi:tetratricopeptide (TPR) repeat protein
MSSLILCHKKKAKKAYEITRIHRKIYTIEELCYYLCNHLYLVDYTIANEQLAEWLEAELELSELAEELNRLLEQNGTIEQFVMTILSYSSIYTSGELKHIQDVLDRLKNQKPVEKQKYKADNLLESGSVKSAIMVYREILYGERDESMEGTFYGKVYACLGAAYGRLFLYKEAAKMYEAAYQICEDKDMLKAYLYASRNFMSGEEYMQLLQRSQLFQDMDSEITKTVREVSDNVTVLQYEDTLEHWKNQYRRISTGEI